MFSNLTIKARLVGTMAFMAILLIVGGAMGITGVSRTNAVLENVFSDRMASAVYIDDSLVRLLQARTALDRAVINPDVTKMAATVSRAEGFHREAEDAWNRYLALPAGDEERKLADEVTRKRQAYLRDGAGALISALRANQHDLAVQIISEKMAPLFSSLSKSADALTNYQKKSAEAAYADSQSMFRVFRLTAVGGVFLGLLAVAISAFFLVRAIMQPLREALGHFERIAAGDLTAEVKAASNNEMGRLLSGLQRMQTGLADTVLNVRRSSAAISSATTQIAAGNQDLSARTEQQASSLEETASSMEELTSTVKQNADNANQANQLATTASDDAMRGGDVVERVVKTMEDIHASSSKIVDIISVIDGIAFQTNILALNAAVEAARAGEQGRGFAVVASEVRSLAQRSATAAKEIKSLIDDSVGKIDAGTALVGEAGDTISQVVQSVKHVADIVNEIAAASREQSAGIDQVNQAIVQMDQVTQQNAALVEEAAAAAESLDSQARRLAEAVSTFKVEERAMLGSPASGTATRPATAVVPAAGARKTLPAPSGRRPATTSVLPTRPAGRQVGAPQRASDEEWEEF